MESGQIGEDARNQQQRAAKEANLSQEHIIHEHIHRNSCQEQQERDNGQYRPGVTGQPAHGLFHPIAEPRVTGIIGQLHLATDKLQIESRVAVRRVKQQGPLVIQHGMNIVLETVISVTDVTVQCR